VGNKETEGKEVQEETVALKVNIPKSLHKQLKLRALVMDTTLKELVVTILEQWVKKKTITPDEL
jgi:predicted HicB family RNase H-like nuclease